MIMSPAFQIMKISLVAVGLALKADMQVGLIAVPVFEQQQQPLYSVPNEEGDIEQFLLLGCVYQFVIQFDGIQRPFRKDKAEQADRQIIATQQMPAHQIYLMPALHLLSPFTLSVNPICHLTRHSLTCRCLKKGTDDSS